MDKPNPFSEEISELKRKQHEQDIMEIRDSAEDIQKKSKELARWIKEAKHLTFFTGAGISTSAGVPDYRSKDGRWTMLEQAKLDGEEKKILKREKAITPVHKAIPTTCHMVMVALQEAGFLKYVISQNCDGLHLKSGISHQNISELHGNANLEYCPECGLQYFRDFDATTRSLTTHKTGRLCKCGAALVDTIINFGETLNPDIIKKAWKNTDQSDLIIVLGSSCKVSPAREMPLSVATRKKDKGKLVIVNLQQTPLDTYSAMRIGSGIDEVMEIVAKELQLTVPIFQLKRKILIQYKAEGAQTRVTVIGIDQSGVEATFVKSAVVTYPRKEEEKLVQAPAQAGPTRVSGAPPPPSKAPPKVLASGGITQQQKFEKIIMSDEVLTCLLPNEVLPESKIKLRFHAHYDELPLVVSLATQDLETKTLDLVFVPQSKYNPEGKWLENPHILHQG